MLQAKVEVISSQNRERCEAGGGPHQQRRGLRDASRRSSRRTPMHRRPADSRTTRRRASLNAAYDGYAFTAHIGQSKRTARWHRDRRDSTTSCASSTARTSRYGRRRSRNIADKKATDWLKTTAGRADGERHDRRQVRPEDAGGRLRSVDQRRSPRLVAQEHAKTRSPQTGRYGSQDARSRTDGEPADGGDTPAPSARRPAATDATPVATAEPAARTPTAPSQPVAPGTNGQ